MKNKVKRLVKIIRYVLFLPFLLLSVIQFLIRELLFGFDNACNYLSKVSSSSLIAILRLRGATIGKCCDIQSGIVFHNGKNFKNISLGDNCHIGKKCFFDLRNRIIVGNNVVISMYSRFITHIDMTPSKLSSDYPAQSAKITIGDDVYIGVGSTVLMGVNIGDCGFVGASSLVIKNIASTTLVVGVPAREVSHVK